MLSFPGDIDYIKNRVVDIDIKRKGSWEFNIRRRGKSRNFILVRICLTYPFFPKAFKNKTASNVIHVNIAGANGKETDASTNFTLSKSTKRNFCNPP